MYINFISTSRRDLMNRIFYMCAIGRRSDVVVGCWVAMHGGEILGFLILSSQCDIVTDLVSCHEPERLNSRWHAVTRPPSQDLTRQDYVDQRENTFYIAVQ